MSIKWLSIFSVVALMSCTACSQQLQKPFKIQTHQPLPAYAAEYETTVINEETQTSTKHLWRFIRSANRVENRNMQDDSGEAWLKAVDGKISYERIFHAQQQVIEYQPADLSAINQEPDWLAINTLVPTSLITKLKADGSETILNRLAIYFHTHDHEKNYEIYWLDSEQLPAKIKRSEHGYSLITQIKALYRLDQLPWTASPTANYRYTDFADLGDKENDPVIRSIRHKLKSEQLHDH